MAASPTCSATRIQASFFFPKLSSAAYSLSGTARWRPETSVARWIWASRSGLKCWRDQWAVSAAVSVSWSA